MKIFIIKVSVFVLIILNCIDVIAQGQCNTGGCTGGSQYPTGTLTSTTNSFVPVSTANWGGEYAVYNVTAGNTYEWSLCSSDGGSVSYDAQLTLMNNSTLVKLCYSDNYCETNKPKIQWTATYTGAVRVLLNQSNCVTNQISTTIVWRCSSCSSGTAPANDNCSGAVALTVDAAATNGTVSGATNSLITGCAGTAEDDVWYKFTTATAGYYTITVAGSASFDAVVDLRSGSCNGTNIQCSDMTNSGETEVLTVSLAAATTYYFRVYDYFSSVPSTLTFTARVTKPGTCTPFYTDGITANDYINNVSLSSINNTSGAGPSYYNDYYSTISTTLNIGSSQSLNVTSGTYGNQTIAAWIDYDQSGTFEAGEKLGEVTGIAAGATGTISFTVPSNATVGNCRMRVRTVWSDIDLDPCATYSYGEAEDYKVIIACVTPGVPASLSTLNIGNSTARLSWVAGTPSGSPDITYYWAVGSASNVTYDANYTQRGTTTSLYKDVSSLSHGTTYYWTVKTLTSCNSSSSTHATSVSFNTTCTTPGTPGSLSISNIDNTSARFSWVSGSPSGSPTVTYYWAIGTSSNVTYDANYTQRGTTASLFKDITTLTPGLTYYCVVKAVTNCAGGSSSAYPAVVSFTTTCTTPGTPASLSTTSILTTSARLNWTAGTPAGTATVTYYWAIGSAMNTTYESNYVQRGTTTSLFVDISLLNPGETYYWNIKAVTSCDNSESSYASVSQFTTSTIVSSVVWNGNTNTDWNTATNWTPNVVPDETIDVIIPAGRPNYPAITTDGLSINNTTVAKRCKSLDINSSANVSVSGAGLYVYCSGVIDIDGTFSHSYGAYGASRFLINTNGAISVNTGGVLNIGNTGTAADRYNNLEINGGSLSVSGGTVNVMGGLIHTSGSFNMSSGNSYFKTYGSHASDNLAKAWETTASSTIALTGGNVYLCGGDEADIMLDWNASQTHSISGGTIYFRLKTLALTGGIDENLNFNFAGKAVKNVVIDRTGYSTILTTSNAIINGNLTITAGTLNSNNLNINTSGNFSNSGTFTAGSGTYTFDGTTAQVISGSSTTGFNNLTLNNSSGLTLSAPVNVSGILTFSAGAVTTDATNILNITNTSTAAISGYSAAKYVKGPMTRAIAANVVADGSTYIFPVADAGNNYRPFELVNVRTGAVSPVIKVTISQTGASTVDGTMNSVQARNWRTEVVSGNFTSTTVRITENGLISSNLIGSSTAQSGNYTSKGGNSIGTTILSNTGITLPNYFAIGLSTGLIVWTGASSTEWNLAGNWNPATIPTENDNVVIPDVSAGSNRYPVTTFNLSIGNATASRKCKTLTINSGASVTLTGGTSFVYASNNLNISGTLNHECGSNSNQFQISGGTTTVKSGGILNVGSSAISGGLPSGTINQYNDIDLDGGTLKLEQNGKIFIQDNLRIAASGAGGNLIVEGGEMYIIYYGNGSSGSLGFDVFPTANVSISGGNIYLCGQESTGRMADWSTSATYSITGGTIHLLNEQSSGAINNPGYCNFGGKTLSNIVVNRSGAASYLVSNHLDVGGNITLTAGTFHANTKNISLAGNFTNNGGTFTGSTGTYTFTGSGKTIGGTTATTFAATTFSSGASITLNSSGTVPQATFGILTVNSNSELLLAAGNVINLTGSANIINGTITANDLFAGSKDVDINHAGTTLSGTGVVNADMQISSGNTTLSSSFILNGDFYINTGTYTMSTHSFNVKGKWSNSGTFVQGTGTVTLNGTNAQSIEGSNTTTFYNLTLNNTAGFTLNKAINVSGTLTMTAGIVNATATNILNVTNTSASAISGYSSTNYIKGPMTRSMSANIVSDGSSFIFPICDASNNYKPVEIINVRTGAVGPVIKATVSASGATTVDATMTSVSQRNWYLEVISGNFTSSAIKVTESGLGSTSSIGTSSAQSGNYTNSGGTNIGTSITSSTGMTLPAYFAVGVAPVGTPGLWTGNLSQDWNNARNWSNFLVPDEFTNVVIPTGRPNYPNITTDGLSINNTSAEKKCKSLEIESSASVTVDGAGLYIYCSGILDIYGTLNHQATSNSDRFQINSGGIVSVKNGAYLNVGSSVVSAGVPAGTVNVYNDIQIDGGQLIVESGGIVFIQDELRLLNNVSSLFRQEGGTVSIARSGQGSTTRNKLFVDANATFRIIDGTLSVQGDADGSTTTYDAIKFVSGSTIDVQGGTIELLNGTTSSDFTLEFGQSTTLNNFIVNKSAKTVFLDSYGFSVNGDLTITAGTLDLNGSNTLNLNGNWINNSAATAFANGTVSLGGSAKEIKGSKRTVFNNLTLLDGSSYTIAHTDVETYETVQGTFTLSENSSLTINSGKQLSLYGDGVLSGTITAIDVLDETVDVGLNGNKNISGSGTINADLRATTNIRTLTSNMSVNGDLLISNTGTFLMTTHQLTVGGSWINDGVFTCGTGTVILTGSGRNLGGTATNGANSDFNHLTIQQGSDYRYNPNNASNNSDVNGNFYLYGDMTIASGKFIDLYASTASGEAIILDGNITSESPLNGVQDIDINNSVNLSGGGNIIADLRIYSGTTTLGSDFTLGGDFTIRSGATFTMSGATNNNFRIAGDFDNSAGVFNCGIGTITFNGTSLQTVDAGSSCYDSYPSTDHPFNNIWVETVNSTDIVRMINNHISVKGTVNIVKGIFSTGSATTGYIFDTHGTMSVFDNGKLHIGYDRQFAACNYANASHSPTGVEAHTHNEACIPAMTAYVRGDFIVHGSVTTDRPIISGYNDISLFAKKIEADGSQDEIQCDVQIYASTTNPTKQEGNVWISGDVIIQSSNAWRDYNNTDTLTIGGNLYIYKNFEHYGVVNLYGNMTNNGNVTGTIDMTNSIFNFYQTGTKYINLDKNPIGFGEFNVKTGTGIREIRQNITTAADLTIESGSTLDNYTTKNIELSGTNASWFNYGTFNQGTGNVTFSGGGEQELGGSVETAFYDLSFNKSNSSNVSMGNNSSVSHTLTLTNGHVVSTPSRYLTLLNGSTISYPASPSNSYVKGPLKKIGFTSGSEFVFPIGKATKSARLSVTPTGTSATNEFTAEYYMNIYSNTTSINAPLNNVSLREYWMLDRGGASTVNAAVKLYWEDSDFSLINSCSAGGDLVVAHWDGTKWIDETNSGGVSGSCSGGSAGTVMSQTVSSFSPFTFGSKSAVLNPLPVELVLFEAKRSGSCVNIKWNCSAEVNNNYFTIEKSKNLLEVYSVGTVPGAGNTNYMTEYWLVDKKPLKGVSYYRLKQTDFDGNLTYSEWVAVDFPEENSESFSSHTVNPDFKIVSLYPNPVRNTANILINSSVSQQIVISVFDLTGRKVFEKTAFISDQISQISFNADNFKMGTYIVLVSNKSGAERIKFVKE